VPERLTNEIHVRDILIAGLGDSIASGEGNPDRPVELSSGGFCFRNYLGGSEYYRPGRARFQGDKSCGGGSGLAPWQRFNAQWSNAACHRSLYSYQTRAALALAVRHPHIAVTYLPLACTGATIDRGLLGSQRARECLVTRNGVTCQGTLNPQVTELKEAIAAARKRQPERQVDLIFLSVGANDIDFSGLVADVIVEKTTERALFSRGGVIGSVDNSRSALTRSLPQDFAKLREALKPVVGGELARVVFVSYANPALGACASGRDGFDIHPAFNADPQRLANVVSYVQQEFLPQMRNLALCEGGVLCRDPRRDRMTLVDSHQPLFANHGMCARSGNDPHFDQQCFSPRGESFQIDPVAGATNPMVCGESAAEFRAYSPRARWIRTANDSYFAAMTYPQGLQSSMQPSDVHDATWGVLSAVYGGAVHPSAEGHAVMADAALPAAISVLGLAAASRAGTEELVQRPLR
jgi:lysophospholipase L1-like esterase